MNPSIELLRYIGGTDKIEKFKIKNNKIDEKSLNQHLFSFPYPYILFENLKHVSIDCLHLYSMKNVLDYFKYLYCFYNINQNSEKPGMPFPLRMLKQRIVLDSFMASAQPLVSFQEKYLYNYKIHSPIVFKTKFIYINGKEPEQELQFLLTILSKFSPYLQVQNIVIYFDKLIHSMKQKRLENQIEETLKICPTNLLGNALTSIIRFNNIKDLIQQERNKREGVMFTEQILNLFGLSIKNNDQKKNLNQQWGFQNQSQNLLDSAVKYQRETLCKKLTHYQFKAGLLDKFDTFNDGKVLQSIKKIIFVEVIDKP
ncbi:hypothetical protein OXYTRIMIC_039 [Oxytricha trifallax]|uniref:Uncharacterized protein n=1 Tax=Oxytricha trifallax TaxID=1172189 RepID=A0A073HZJ9_9SPIT|nr:hypothetical protein OXYTRIMIC_039 [Oxytricha trifallax]